MTVNLALASIKSASGTTSQTFAARFDVVHNVMDFGATGDGTTDDTTAIQRAIDWNSVTLVTNATTAAGNAVLHFASVPASIGSGSNVNITNLTSGATIPTPALVLSTTATSVTMNVNAAGAGVGNGDSIIFRFSNLGEIFFPAGNYKITSALTLNYQGELSFILRGVGSASKLVGNTSGYVIDRSNSDPGSGVKLIDSLWVTNSHVTGGGIRLLGAVGGRIQNCQVGAYQGISLADGGGPNSIHNCVLQGGGSAGSIGILAQGLISVNGCDITGWDEGVRHWSLGFSSIGTRYESNSVGIMLGKTGAGASSQSAAFLIAGGSMEANVIGIDFNSALYGMVAGLSVAGGSSMTTGLYCHGMTSCTIAAVSVSGIYTSAAIDVQGAGNQNVFISVTATVTSGGGSDWLVNGDSGAYMTCIRCDNPTLAIAFVNLPGSPVDGDRNYITNCNTATFGATAAAGGANHVPVYYDSSAAAWKVG